MVTPAHHETAMTTTALVYEDKDCILHLLMIPGHRTVEQAQETMREMQRIARDRRMVLLVDVLPLVTTSQDAFDAVYRSPIMQQLQAVAFVGEPHHTGIMRRCIERLQITSPAWAIFDSKPAAREWLLSFKKGC